MAYDIGCSFKTTAANSELGPVIRQKGITFGVPAWHGWSHNRLCQTSHHPLYVEGTGIEDSEGTERLWAWTNLAARPLRNSTPFHRHQGLEMAFRQWNKDKYLNLGE